MLKGVFVFLLALIFLALCDYTWSDGRYTDLALMMGKHIKRSFGV